jgi:hypothetical protein
LTFGRFELTFWKCHYFWSLRLPTSTNLGMEISMVYSKLKNDAFFEG